MAIYHLEAKIVSRGSGRSAVTAAAYMSCSRMLNDYDGKQYDYSRMQRAEKDVATMLGEKVETPSIRQQLRELSNEQEPRRCKPKEHEQER